MELVEPLLVSVQALADEGGSRSSDDGRLQSRGGTTGPQAYLGAVRLHAHRFVGPAFELESPREWTERRGHEIDLEVAVIVQIHEEAVARLSGIQTVRVAVVKESAVSAPVQLDR